MVSLGWDGCQGPVVLARPVMVLCATPNSGRTRHTLVDRGRPRLDGEPAWSRGAHRELGAGRGREADRMDASRWQRLMQVGSSRRTAFKAAAGALAAGGVLGGEAPA